MTIDWPVTLELWKNIATVAAALAAAGFFGWKLIAGWLIVNLDIEIKTTRAQKNDEEDFLAFTLWLRKGNIDTLHLKNISVRLTNQLTPEQMSIVQIDDIQKLHIAGDYAIHWDKFDWEDRMEKKNAE